MVSADAPLASIGVLAAAMAYHVAGCVLLVLGAPPLAALHAFAAFILLSIVAAVHQLVPVLFRATSFPWAMTLGVACGFTLGFALLIAGFYGMPTFAAAGFLLAVSALVWCAALFTRVVTAKAERLTSIVIGSAFIAFCVAGVFGVTMAYQFATAHGLLAWMPQAHGALMVVAFASLLVVALSYRFVPMFSLSHANAYGKRILAWAVLIGGVSVAAGWNRVGFVLVLVALVVIGMQHVIALRTRVRKRIDMSLIYGAAAWILAIGACGVGLFSVNGATAPALLMLGILGWLSITIFGYALKIVGFLSWEFAKNRRPDARLTALSSAVSLRSATIALILLLLGTLALTASQLGLGISLQLAASIDLVGALAYIYTFVRTTLPYLRV